jgi:photosystem I P700 chlorophyll a apoprotein A1
MTISPPEREAKSKIVVDRDPVEQVLKNGRNRAIFTCFSKGPTTTTWI